MKNLGSKKYEKTPKQSKCYVDDTETTKTATTPLNVLYYAGLYLLKHATGSK